MATINYKYCEDEDLYNSGEIEERLLNAYKNNKSLDDEDFFYSITPVRENIINWYPFKKDSNILEIGGGLGAITGELCKKGKKVVSCEYSKRRAENIYYRHINQKNLEVIVGNFNKIKFKEKFDYIVLIGVFEYAKRFCKSDNPFNTFLENMKKLLKDDGVILIAIENRYGIKYFAGAPEDHYGKKYLGLENYDNYDIQTLGKYELSTIIEKSGFKNYKYYYPYPDYKMPYVIYTDDRTPLKTELPSLYFYNHDNPYYEFDYRKVIGGIIDNKQYGFFANSFLVEMTNDKSKISDIVYAKTFWFREKNYQIYTIIKKNGSIFKIPKFSSAIPHLEKMIEVNNFLNSSQINVPTITRENNVFKIEKIEGETLAECIQDLTKKKEKENIINEIDNYIKLLEKISLTKEIAKFAVEEERNFYKLKKEKILKMGLIDLHFSNIIKNKTLYYVIDQEWVSQYEIPLKYMLYFSINYLFEWIYDFDLLFTKEELYLKYEITSEEIKIFDLMSKHFTNVELKNVDKKTYNRFMLQNKYIPSESRYDTLKNDIDILTKENEEKKLESYNLYKTINNFLIENDELKKEAENIKEELFEKNKQISNYEKIISSKRWTYVNKICSLKEKIFK